MNALHIAWLGDKNFGDDLMAQAIRDAFLARHPDTTFLTWCEKRPAHRLGVKWIYPFQLPRGVGNRFWEQRALQKADILIVGGGSVLHSARSSNWKRQAVEGFKRMHPRGKAVGIGLSIGPFTSSVDEAACISFLKSLDACALREKESFDFAQTQQLPYAPIKAFDLCASYLQHHGFSAKQQTEKISCVGVSVRLPHKTDVARTTKKYVQLLKELSETFPRIKLFSFSNDSTQYEANYCKNLIAEAGSKNIELVTYANNIDDFLSAIRSVDFFITTKLHGLLLSFLLNIPCGSISYQKKFDDFCADLHIPQHLQWTQENFDPTTAVNSVAPYMYIDQRPFFEEANNSFRVFDI
jgi:polysaccharide pyruvyl transferase WcaK-like protein